MKKTSQYLQYLRKQSFDPDKATAKCFEEYKRAKLIIWLYVSQRKRVLAFALAGGTL